MVKAFDDAPLRPRLMFNIVNTGDGFASNDNMIRMSRMYMSSRVHAESYAMTLNDVYIEAFESITHEGHMFLGDRTLSNTHIDAMTSKRINPCYGLTHNDLAYMNSRMT